VADIWTYVAELDGSVFQSQFDNKFKDEVDDLDEEDNVMKALRDLLIKAGVDVEFDLTDPDIMETVRDFLVDFKPKRKDMSEDEAHFGAQMMTNKH